MALMMGGDSRISAFLEEDNIFCWVGTISGNKETVKFETSCFHPNVVVHGNILPGYTKDKWSSAYVRTIFLSIQSLLGGWKTVTSASTKADGKFSIEVKKTHMG